MLLGDSAIGEITSLDRWIYALRSEQVAQLADDDAGATDVR